MLNMPAKRQSMYSPGWERAGNKRNNKQGISSGFGDKRDFAFMISR
jgi:hypothetical protein